MTLDEYRALIVKPSVAARNPELHNPSHLRDRPLSIIQEQEKNSSGSVNREAAQLYRSEDQKKDERAGGCYRVSVIFLVSGNRKRDAFGMLETVADALVRAVRRFNSGNPMRIVGD